MDLALDSTSGRPKHTDPTEAGGWLFSYIEPQLRELADGIEGVAILGLNYFGTDKNGQAVLGDDMPPDPAV